MYLASFCGFAPVNNPAVVGVVMLFDPRGQFYYGGRIAAPVFSTVVRQALRVLDVPPSRIPALPVRPPAEVDAVLLADFIEGRANDVEDEPIFPGRNVVGPGPAWREAPAAETVAADVSRQPESVAIATIAQEPYGGSLTAPDVLGLTMREVFALGAQHGIPIEPHGSGLAQQQYPGPNEALSAGDPIKVVFGTQRVELRDASRLAGEGGG